MPYKKTLLGVLKVLEVISDTGPLLHLHEIGRLACLDVFDHLILPNLVLEELDRYRVHLQDLVIPTLAISEIHVPQSKWREALPSSERQRIQSADAQVFFLAQDRQFDLPVLTDDLALRRLVESRGGLVVGSIGVLIRAYKHDLLDHRGLSLAIDALFSHSTLHISAGFKVYVTKLINGLPL